MNYIYGLEWQRRSCKEGQFASWFCEQPPFRLRYNPIHTHLHAPPCFLLATPILMRVDKDNHPCTEASLKLFSHFPHPFLASFENKEGKLNWPKAFHRPIWLWLPSLEVCVRAVYFVKLRIQKILKSIHLYIEYCYKEFELSVIEIILKMISLSHAILNIYMKAWTFKVQILYYKTQIYVRVGWAGWEEFYNPTSISSPPTNNISRVVELVTHLNNLDLLLFIYIYINLYLKLYCVFFLFRVSSWNWCQ